MGTAIFYASSTGNTQIIAQEISKKLGDATLVDIADEGITTLAQYDKVILGLSTWGEGELQDDWDDVWDELKDIDFSNKTIALFGLGDQEDYGYNYVDAMGIAYEELENRGATIVGKTVVTDEYYYEESRAVVDGKFVGLALDEDNQDNLTQERITNWCEEIAKDIL
ncbi:MAG: flavodoxin [Arcobacteraceae bacterium]